MFQIHYLMFAAFGIAAYFMFLVVKHGGFRGAMFGARVVRTIGELDVGRARGCARAINHADVRECHQRGVSPELLSSCCPSVS